MQYHQHIIEDLNMSVNLTEDDYMYYVLLPGGSSRDRPLSAFWYILT